MPQHVQLFITCLIDTFLPEIGEAVVMVLERQGLQVGFPARQACCGQPAFNAGLRKDARPMAEQTIRAFEDSSGPVITPSGSCAAMIRHSYLELFAGDPAWLSRAQALAARTYEFSEYLVDVLGVEDVGARFPGKLSYHSSCHLLRGLGVDRQPRALLAHVREAELVELPYADECCGFGGVFSVVHPELSAELLKRKISNFEKTAAPTLVVADTGCLMNIQGGLKRQGKAPAARRRVLHIAEVLANSASAGRS
jgi:L-lactate dehydrogenase complex protein LldE